MLGNLLWNLSHWTVEKKNIDRYYARLCAGEGIVIPDSDYSGITKEALTSGTTTGVRKSVFLSKEQLELRSATWDWTRTWTGFKIGEPRAHLWYGTVREGNKLKTFIRSQQSKMAYKLDNCLFLNYFDMGDRAMSNYCRQLNEFKPVMLEGYSEALNILAEYVIDTSKTVKIPIVLSCAGHITGEWREHIKQAFDCELYSRYGCTEVGAIAQEVIPCSDDYKVVTQRGLVVTQGKGNSILITDLNNKTGTRFSDYDLGDTGEVYTKNGKTYIEGLQGKIKGPRSWLRIHRGE